MDEILRLGVPIIACVIGGFLLLIGGVIIVAFLLTVWKGIRSRSWPATFGWVISSEAATKETELMPGDWQVSSDFSEQAAIVYEYEVRGERYISDTLQVRGNMQTARTVRRERELLSRYPAGKSLVVYYNPAKPEEAVLQPGVPRGLLPLTAGGAVLFLVGLVVILVPTGAVRFPPGPMVTGLVFLVPGLALTLLGLSNVWTAVASRTWPTAEAKVTHSEVMQVSDGLSFQPNVAYRYEVHGVTYTATAIDWGRPDMPRAEAQRLVDQYPVGKLVTVHYSPMNPHRAVIEPRIGWMYGLVLLLGVVFAVAGTLVILS